VYLGYVLAAIIYFIGINLMLHALGQNNLPLIHAGQDVPVQEHTTGVSLLIILTTVVVTVIWSLVSPPVKALSALENASKFAYRYTQLPDDCTAEQRITAAQKMDFWTQQAEATAHRYLEELIDHKDRWSAIIRVAHETRLEDANRQGIPALVS